MAKVKALWEQKIDEISDRFMDGKASRQETSDALKYLVCNRDIPDMLDGLEEARQPDADVPKGERR